MVTIYGFPECPYCTELKTLLTEKGIEFIDINVDLEENKEEFEKILEVSKAEEVPVIKIGKQLLVPNVSFKTIKEAADLTEKFLA